MRLNIPGQVTGRIEFLLRETVTEPRKSIAIVLYVPIVRSDFSHGLFVVHSAPRPRRRDPAVRGVVLMAVAAVVAVYCTLHPFCNLRDEVLLSC